MGSGERGRGSVIIVVISATISKIYIVRGACLVAQ